MSKTAQKARASTVPRSRSSSSPSATVVAADPVASESLIGAAGPERAATVRLNLQTLEFIASPFRSFRDIGKFQSGLSSVPGVQSVHARQLQHGALQLRIECRGAAELLEGLATAYPVPFLVVSREPHQIEIVFKNPAEAIESEPVAGRRSA